MTTESARRCECGHAQDAHTDGRDACTLCPSSAVWVASQADWIYPCPRFLAR